jgi:hypothetical protein
MAMEEMLRDIEKENESDADVPVLDVEQPVRCMTYMI